MDAPSTTHGARPPYRGRTVAVIVVFAAVIAAGTAHDRAPLAAANIPAAGGDSGPVAVTAVVASAAGTAVHSPVGGSPLVGFHQASYDDAVAMSVREDDPHAAAAMLLPSRDRTTGRTTAVDVVAKDSQTIVAPVTGTVLVVERYRLYGQHDDVKLVIRPAGRHDQHVTVLHVVDPLVVPGQIVVGGHTPIARSANLLPFTSQIDRFAGGRVAHVHIEVKDVGG